MRDVRDETFRLAELMIIVRPILKEIPMVMGLLQICDLSPFDSESWGR